MALATKSGGGKAAPKKRNLWGTIEDVIQASSDAMSHNTLPRGADERNRIGGMSDAERRAFEDWTSAFAPSVSGGGSGSAPGAPTYDDGSSGSGGGGSASGGDPYTGVREQIMSQYNTGQADLTRSALGGRNSIGDAGSSFQKAVASLGRDARREGNLAGKNMQDSLAALLRSHDSGMARSVGDLERQGFDDPRLRALMSENGASIRRQGVSNRGYQDRLMEVFGQGMNARQQGGKMITEGALSQLANVQHLQQGQLDAQKQKALSDLVASQAATRSRGRSGGGGSGSGGASGSTGYIDENGIFHQAVGYSKDAEYALGVDDKLSGSMSPEAKRIYDRMSGQRKGKTDQQLHDLQRRVDAGEDWHDLQRRFSSFGNDKELNSIVYDYFRPYDVAEKTRKRRDGLVHNPPTGTKG